MKTTLFCYLFLCLFIDNVLEISSEWSFQVEYNVLEQKMITFLLIDDYIIVCNFVQYTKNHTHTFSLETELFYSLLDITFYEPSLALK